jgi:hypothetical protein
MLWLMPDWNRINGSEKIRWANGILYKVQIPININQEKQIFIPTALATEWIATNLDVW